MKISERHAAEGTLGYRTSGRTSGRASERTNERRQQERRAEEKETGDNKRQVLRVSVISTRQNRAEGEGEEESGEIMEGAVFNQCSTDQRP